MPPDQSGALPTPRDRRNDWLRSLPGVRGFAIVSPAGRPETAAGALDAMELQRQTYLAMLARRVGEELGLAQLAELEVEGPDGRLLLLRQDDGGTLHVLGSANLDPHAIRHGHGGER
ncbi:MAG TPA: hypothetical protein RMH85_23805 [Polyangiaceae bacterium LLY-WYZ-15_(1-7)]|nr:hypothetical protein [Polyangiaceae bacterium LLY-WYZ-15_(1-7)]HJL04959.1 hypothetical protein [Polyangiaceae bacterium LLY-WYZ-15_(1-7)]HJL11522.1 hypothetical protein [Polyangiaceae bacterium LLY-WYZ-15_(1-7)]HJL29526.1 hypothetical protein [Polyangiaceae bacterium LLY-WYZ-15_(1-7)]HJL36858.1 hypothetical protein [Polyangiaceae bacterium LLY-WYZ-15_(1-7)]